MITGGNARSNAALSVDSVLGNQSREVKNPGYATAPWILYPDRIDLLARKIPMDPYAACPCGSGKKYRWCCQPIYADITHAFQQDQEGQHDAARRLRDQVTTAHPNNPEAWRRQAD